MAELPTGTVTFLFTDIEGSTRLWQQRPAEMRIALARHDALLHEVVRRHDGNVFKTVGDAFCAAFATASDALAAALAGQRALAQEPWPEAMRIAVRMALHTGTAEVRDDDYFGQPLNRVARLLAAGHGGQVLLSLAAQELVRDGLPAGVALRDLGERRLKDLVRPERVYQVLAPDLPADFAPLKTLDIRTHNLPVQFTSFIGRDREMREVKDLLKSSRLVTLTGSGGAGKTRLALQVAADLVDEFADGTWFVDLSPLADAHLVPQAVAMVLGVKERPGVSLTDALTEDAKDKQLLLVLDNCEHLVQACAVFCQTLLSTCVRVRIVASSREALRITAEAAFRVPPLGTPDPKVPTRVESLTQYAAVQLFIDRAVAVQSSFRVDNANAAAVASICHQLDGIPLAIELAAARVRSLSVDDVNERLDQRFRLLKGGSRTALPRQQTLRALIDWSYDLLTVAEKALLDRLAVFAGGCTLAAAEKVCSGNDVDELEVVDLLTSLADKSLVVVEPGGSHVRYRLLETVRQYARDRLAERNEALQWQRRHLAHFLPLAQDAGAGARLRGADASTWLDLLQVEHDNLRAALAWSSGADGDAVGGLRLAGAMMGFWMVRGHLGEGRRWLSAALAAVPEGENGAARAGALRAAGIFAAQQGDATAAQKYLEESLVIRQALGDRKSIAHGLSNIALLAVDRGDYRTASALQEEVLGLWREFGDRTWIAVSLESIGCTALACADYPTARSRLEEALAIYRELNSPWMIAGGSLNLGIVMRSLGDPATARALFEESLALARTLGNKRSTANALNGLALVAADQRDYASAAALHQQSLAEFRDLGDRSGIAWSLEGLAYATFALVGPAAAARIWGGAERLRQEIQIVVPLNDQPRYDDQVAAARATLGDDEIFDRAWQEGRAMPLAQMIESALGRMTPDR